MEKARTKGHGLTNIQNRAEEIATKLTINSEQGKGDKMFVDFKKKKKI